MSQTNPTLTLLELETTAVPGLESYSPFCLKAHRALNAATLPYARRALRMPGERKRMNPTGQVPVLLVGDEPVRDSTNILRRVMELAPRRIDGSPEAWLWEELADTALNGFLVAARWADNRNWPLVRNAYFGAMPWPVSAIVPGQARKRVLGALHGRDVIRAGMPACWERYQRLLDQLDARSPERDFWLGQAISVADLGLFGQLHSLRTDLTAWQRDELAQRHRLSRYLDRVDEATRDSAAKIAA